MENSIFQEIYSKYFAYLIEVIDNR